MAVNCVDQFIADRAALYQGDCCEVASGIPDNSIGMTVFSPPFSDLYCYSSNERDLGNCRTREDFFGRFAFLAREILRATQPGRIVAIHCMDMPIMKERDGYIGIYDFPGDIIRMMLENGFIHHSRVVIWKDPLIEATRTKALGLMHKQLCKDSTKSRQGLPDYIIAFRKPGENSLPVDHPDGLTTYAGSKDPGGAGIKRSHNIWRAYASPVWMDIRQTRTLNREGAREEADEKHVCPLQLDVIERCLTLWSNPGDTVLTPFLGVGSEAYCAVKTGRRAVGIELKPTYFKQAVRNVESALHSFSTGEENDLFTDAEPEPIGDDEEFEGEELEE